MIDVAASRKALTAPMRLSAHREQAFAEFFIVANRDG
jgi:hypothetical protein